MLRIAPPMTVTMPVPADAVVLRAGAPRVGWWDALASCWRTDGVEGAAYGVSEDGRRSVTFSTPHLTSFALLQVSEWGGDPAVSVLAC